MNDTLVEYGGWLTLLAVFCTIYMLWKAAKVAAEARQALLDVRGQRDDKQAAQTAELSAVGAAIQDPEQTCRTCTHFDLERGQALMRQQVTFAEKVAPYVSPAQYVAETEVLELDVDPDATPEEVLQAHQVARSARPVEDAAGGEPPGLPKASSPASSPAPSPAPSPASSLEDEAASPSAKPSKASSPPVDPKCSWSGFGLCSRHEQGVWQRMTRNNRLNNFPDFTQEGTQDCYETKRRLDVVAA